MASIEEFLRGINVPQYTEALYRSGKTSIAEIAGIQDEDLEKCGVFLRGHRKKILAAAKKWVEGQGASGAPSKPASAGAYDNVAPPKAPPKGAGMYENAPMAPPKSRYANTKVEPAPLPFKAPSKASKLQPPQPRERGVRTAQQRQIQREHDNPNPAIRTSLSQKMLLTPSMSTTGLYVDDDTPSKITRVERSASYGSMDLDDTIDVDTILANQFAEDEKPRTQQPTFDFGQYQEDLLKDGDLDINSLMEDLSALETDTAVFQAARAGIEAEPSMANIGPLGPTGGLGSGLRAQNTPTGLIGGNALALAGSVHGQSFAPTAAFGNIVLGPDPNAGTDKEEPTPSKFVSKYVGKTHREIEDATLAEFKQKLDSTSAAEKLAMQAVSEKKKGPTAADTAAVKAGLSENALAKGNYQGLSDQQKFALAMKKMEQATGLQTVVIKVSDFEKNEVSIPINTETTARVLLGSLVKKFGAPPDAKYCLFEVVPTLRMERLVEDHENIFSVNKCWGFVMNKFVFGISSFKPIRYDCDHWDLKWGPIRASAPIPIPPLEGNLHWAIGNDKGKKMKWRSNYFVIRESGLWIPKDPKKDKTANLTQFLKFEDMYCYITMKPKQMLNAPSDFAIAFKRKREFTPGSVKYLCLPSQADLMKWIIGSRVGIYGGDVLRRNELFYIEGQVIGSEEQSIYEAQDKAVRIKEGHSPIVLETPPSMPTAWQPPRANATPPMPRPDARRGPPLPTKSSNSSPETPPKLSKKTPSNPSMKPPVPVKRSAVVTTGNHRNHDDQTFPYKAEMQKLQAMGFQDSQKIMAALQQQGGSVPKAAQKLCEQDKPVQTFNYRSELKEMVGMGYPDNGKVRSALQGAEGLVSLAVQRLGPPPSGQLSGTNDTPPLPTKGRRR